MKVGGTRAYGVGRITFPAGGILRLQVDEPVVPPWWLDEFPDATGPYVLMAAPVNRAPESVSPVLVAGVDVQGESIDHPGDIDEFTFAGRAGDSTSVLLRPPLTGLEVYAHVTIIDQSMGQVVNVITFSNTGATIVWPTTGEYLFRVEGVNEFNSYGGYRLLITR